MQEPRTVPSVPRRKALSIDPVRPRMTCSCAKRGERTRERERERERKEGERERKSASLVRSRLGWRERKKERGSEERLDRMGGHSRMAACIREGQRAVAFGVAFGGGRVAVGRGNTLRSAPRRRRGVASETTTACLSMRTRNSRARRAMRHQTVSAGPPAETVSAGAVAMLRHVPTGKRKTALKFGRGERVSKREGVGKKIKGERGKRQGGDGRGWGGWQDAERSHERWEQHTPVSVPSIALQA
eukprot:3701759-Rhodomonas_salina.2